MPKQLRSAETRERILAAAEACFAIYGYDLSSTAEICRRAGLSKGAFYHHFPTKNDLWREILDRWLGALDTQLAAARAQAGSVPDALHAMTAAIGPVFRSLGKRKALFLEFWTRAAHDPQAQAAAREPYRRYQDFFAELIRAGVAEGSLKPVEPETAAQVLVSLSVGLLLQSLIDPDQADWGQRAEANLKLLLSGLEPEKKKPGRKT